MRFWLNEPALMRMSRYSPHAAIALVLLVNVPAFVTDLPDPSVTPGAVGETHTAVICVPGYSSPHRTWRERDTRLIANALDIAVTSVGKILRRAGRKLGWRGRSPEGEQRRLAAVRALHRKRSGLVDASPPAR